MPKQKKHCLVCGKIFLPRINHGKEQKFCSRVCSDKSRIKKECACGSSIIDERCKIKGGSYHIIKCRDCFEEWFKKRNCYDYKCSLCGNTYKRRSRVSIKKEKETGLCFKCSHLRKTESSVFFLNCGRCGFLFTSKKDNHLYCKKCRSRVGIFKVKHSSKKEHKRYINYCCVDCGIKLNRNNKNHRSTSFVCNDCMWLRRRNYKTNKIIGYSVPETTRNNIVLLDIISRAGKTKLIRGEKTWRQKTLISRAERLLRKRQ